jgi:exosortase family protein XrtF
LKKNKVVILFLTKFFVVYFLLTGLYSVYLNNTQEKGITYVCSPVTKVVTNHAESITKLFGYKVYTDQNQHELSMKFVVNDQYIVKIVEGCTSISVMVLFLAFIIAFKGGLRDTILFGISGLMIIYLTNIFRIAALSIIIYHYPENQEIMHSLFFPAAIYGMVFLLWIIWVNKFAIINKK